MNHILQYLLHDKSIQEVKMISFIDFVMIVFISIFRKNKTSQETQKLQHVQTELQKIDDIVAGDVRLLRKTIEDASYAYMEAQ